jgi:hypothetical protein
MSHRTMEAAIGLRCLRSSIEWTKSITAVRRNGQIYYKQTETSICRFAEEMRAAGRQSTKR